jgi:transcription elongation factor GreA
MRGRPKKKKVTNSIDEIITDEEEKLDDYDENSGDYDDIENKILDIEDEDDLRYRKDSGIVEINKKEKPTLTKHGLSILKNELKELKSIKRQEVAERIRQAREFGDISENSEYEEAKRDQVFIENRVAELEQLLKTAIIIDISETEDKFATVGTVVSVKDLDNFETKNFKIVGTLEADPLSDTISNSSPVGKALIGRRKGDIVRIITPKGRIKYRVTNIKRSEDEK